MHYLNSLCRVRVLCKLLFYHILLTSQDHVDIFMANHCLYRAFYEVLDFQVLCQRPEDVISTVATVKVRVGNQVEITAAEGDGPVNALDCALRRVLTLFYPQLKRLRLVDFKVRVVDSDGGTASRVRVHIRSTDGRLSFGTVGVSTSILQAAWTALVDSIDAMLLSDLALHPCAKKGGVA